MVLCSDLIGHRSLTQLVLYVADLRETAAIEALVDVANEKQLTILHLDACMLRRVASPALTRLLGGCSLTSLYISYCVVHDDNLEITPAFSNAVRSSRLHRLTLRQVRLFDFLANGLDLVAAVTRHPTLQHINLSCNDPELQHRSAVGAALGALVAANSPSLTSLKIWSSRLGDAGMRPLSWMRCRVTPSFCALIVRVTT